MMSIFKEQREAVREKILQTASALFREKGYGQVTIDQITRSVGIAKGTFYNFFITKREILMAWAIETFDGLDLKKALQQGRTVEENLSALVEAMSAAIVQEGPLFVSFLEELIRDYGNRDLIGRFDFLSLFSEAIVLSSDFSCVSEGLDDKLMVLNSSMFMAVIDWFNSGKSAEGLEKHLQKVISICLYGMMAR